MCGNTRIWGSSWFSLNGIPDSYPPPPPPNPLSASLAKVLEMSQHVGIKKTTGTEQKYVLKIRKPTRVRL